MGQPQSSQPAYLPGCDPKSFRVREPAPETYEDAEYFLRTKCKTVVELGEESDFWKVTCQADNPAGEKGKQYQEQEIIKADVQRRRNFVMNVARMMHEWRDRQINGENPS
jgi:hypothetical protein